MPPFPFGSVPLPPVSFRSPVSIVATQPHNQTTKLIVGSGAHPDCHWTLNSNGQEKNRDRQIGRTQTSKQPKPKGFRASSASPSLNGRHKPFVFVLPSVAHNHSCHSYPHQPIGRTRRFSVFLSLPVSFPPVFRSPLCSPAGPPHHCRSRRLASLIFSIERSGLWAITLMVPAPLLLSQTARHKLRWASLVFSRLVFSICLLVPCVLGLVFASDRELQGGTRRKQGTRGS